MLLTLENEQFPGARPPTRHPAGFARGPPDKLNHALLLLVFHTWNGEERSESQSAKSTWEDAQTGLQKEDRGGHIVLESIIFSLQYKAGPQGVLVNPKGGARFATDRR